MPESVQKTPLIQDGDFDVVEVKDLAFFDLTGEKAKVKGTSNKQYFAEMQVSKTNPEVCQIYTIWGATGASNQTREWRHYTSRAKADKDFASIIKSKTKKGYQEIDVAVRTYGSDKAKAITKSVILKNAPEINNPQSSLHKEVQRVVGELFNITNNWVITTLRCPLGQLTNAQIDKGHYILNECKSIVENNTVLSADDKKKLENFTNDFYGAIPHNLGQGARGQMIHLLLDDKLKIAQKSEDLDLLLDAKDAGASLSSTTNVDAKYKTLNAEFKFVEHDSQIFKWVDAMVHETRAPNHHFLGKIKVHNVFELSRNNEENVFLKNAEKIANDKPKYFVPNILKTLNNKRPDVRSDKIDLYKNANILPVWHGTRRANIVGITMKGFLIRPAGVVICGAMYGNGAYFGHSSKSINYVDCKNSYWAQGSSSKGFMFLNDVALGNPYRATYSSSNFGLHNINGCHSLYAEGGKSGVINDEFIVYNPTGPNQQHQIRYLVEFETGIR